MRKEVFVVQVVFTTGQKYCLMWDSTQSTVVCDAYGQEFTTRSESQRIADKYKELRNLPGEKIFLLRYVITKESYDGIRPPSEHPEGCSCTDHGYLKIIDSACPKHGSQRQEPVKATEEGKV